MDELFERKLDALTTDINTLMSAIADIQSTLRSIERQLASGAQQNGLPMTVPPGGALGGRAKTIGEIQGLY